MMGTLSEMASGIAKQAKSIGMEAATLALRLADAECKTTEPTESLVDHCAKVAEKVAEMPDWKKGSAVNERTPRQFNSTAQADWDDQHRGKTPSRTLDFASMGTPFTSDRNPAPAPVDGDLVERAKEAARSSLGHASGLMREVELQSIITAVGPIFQQDSNARWEKAIRKGLADRKEQYVDSVLFDIRFHVKAGSLPPTLQERIAELEAQLASIKVENTRLQWQPITPENPPVKDMLVCGRRKGFNGVMFWDVAAVDAAEASRPFDYWNGYTHMAKFTPPVQTPEAEHEL
jgi:hypothetical protein